MLSGLFPGLINGLLGTGGGILAVNFFRNQGLPPNQAHATAVAMMLPLSGISLAVLLCREAVDPFSYWPLIIPTLMGSAAGSWLLKRTKPQHLRLLFALLLIYSAVRILRQ